jgi:putative aminopeptidase FrvX
VWVGGKTGVIGARSGHLTPRSEQGQGLAFADLYVDLGVDSAAEGIITFEVKLPRRYSHSPVEMLDLRDLVAALALVEELVIHPPAAEELAFLRNGEHS